VKKSPIREIENLLGIVPIKLKWKRRNFTHWDAEFQYFYVVVWENSIGGGKFFYRVNDKKNYRLHIAKAAPTLLAAKCRARKVILKALGRL
jgi:hypothetical protein